MFNPKTFLGDAAFDSALLYKELLTGDTFGQNRYFSKAYIPLNARSALKNEAFHINEDGFPCCPHDSSIPMEPKGSATRPNRWVRYKFVCPKIKWGLDRTAGKYHREYQCKDPCTDSKYGRMVYIYPEQDLRAYPGTLRGTPE